MFFFGAGGQHWFFFFFKRERGGVKKGKMLDLDDVWNPTDAERSWPALVREADGVGGGRGVGGPR